MNTSFKLLVAIIVLGVCAGFSCRTNGMTQDQGECQKPDRWPKIISWVKPEYPARAKEDTLHGMVTVAVYVTAADTVSESFVKVSCGNAEFDAAVLKSAKASRYLASRKDCEFIGAWFVFDCTIKQ